MNEQIEEMARIASKCITSWLNNETPKALPDYIAETFYNTGYRKFSESELNKQIQELTFKSIDLNIHQQFDEDFAKMIMRWNNNSKSEKENKDEQAD